MFNDVECHTHMSYSVSYSCSDVLREKDALMVTLLNRPIHLTGKYCNCWLCVMLLLLLIFFYSALLLPFSLLKTIMDNLKKAAIDI